MHIGIDGRPLSKRLTGIGRYTFELSMRLAQIPDAQLSFYLPSHPCPEVGRELGSQSLRVASSNSRISNMVWSQTKLPLLAKNDCVDIFWGPTHRLPRLLPELIARVVTIHDLVWKYAPQTMRPLSLFTEKRLMPKAIARADLVIADSHSTAFGISETFPEHAHKIRVVHLGVSALLGPANPEALLQLNICKPYFLFVGTIEPRKNLDRLLNAFALVPKSIRGHFSLVIAGSKGWGDIEIDKLISKYQLNDSVKFLGFVNDLELSALYSSARFLAMPSIYEGFGLPLLEAMQYGKPVLTSHEGSLAEVAGTSGILVDPFSVQSISLGIQKMLEDDELIESLGKAALKRAQEFSWEKCAAETMAVFKEAMALRDLRISCN